jgi:cell division transport system permease protein
MSFDTPPEGPVFPPRAQPLKTLTAVMAVMCFLAVLAVGALIMINRAVDQWSKGLSSEVTVQVKIATGRDLDQDIADVIALLTETQGVQSAFALSREDAEKLLEPWLGSEGLDKLPVPALVRVILNQDAPPDFEKLATALKDKVPVAQLDTHRRWEAELRRMAGTLAWLSWLVLFLIAVSAALIVASASRAVLATQASIVEALIMAGAEDRFIADAVGRRFILAGLVAGLVGLIAGLAVFAALGFFSTGYDNVAQAARGLFYLPPGDRRMALISFGAIPVAATVIALIASRFALGQLLRRLA